MNVRMKTWDAIVVGAGPGGCAAAYDLARAGREVLLLDRAEFPRQKACAGGLTLKTVQTLRYPVDAVVRERVSEILVENTPRQSLVLRRKAPYCFMTVRQEFDDYCFRRTVAAGAHFQRAGAITSIDESDEGVTVAVDGQTFHGHFLVGADGVHSQVRKLTEKDVSWFWRAFALEAMVTVPNVERQKLVFDFSAVRDGYGWVFPKGDHVNIGMCSYAQDETVDRKRLAAYIAARYNGAIAEHVMGQYAGCGAANHQIPASRVFLVGDAGGFVDPLTGEGIYFALVSGQAAAAAVHAGLDGNGPAHLHFSKLTAQLRIDLGISTSAGRWFYANLDQGFRLLAMPIVRSVVVRTFASGLKLAKLASWVRTIRSARN